MAPHTDLTREIDESPAGPRIGAFFDVDRTLLAGFSVGAFIRDGVWNGRMVPGDVVRTLVAATQFQLGYLGFSGFVGGTAAMLRGHSVADAEEIAERVFVEALAGELYPEARALVRAHHRKGHTVAVVSSATRYQIDPLARELHIPHVLCTQLEVEDGRFTGRVLRPTCYGQGKALAGRLLAEREHLDLAQSYFYTDSDEDLPLLELVGHPRPTNPNTRLARIAIRRRWPMRRFHSRGTPDAVQVLRTGLALASLGPALALGLPAALLDRSWRRAVNVTITTWGELGTALAGIEVHVRGEEHLWSRRPAVFIFNHQSGVDMLLLCRLLRRDIVGVAKQELRHHPLFGLAFALAGTVFVDRFHHERAVKALAPAIDALRQGLSLVIAPEGTRSATGRVGRFKKGAFHAAMAAGVPIVPIVFRNALDALPKHGIVVRPTTVEVVVHPPIPTSGWTVAELDERIAAIHRWYVETLET